MHMYIHTHICLYTRTYIYIYIIRIDYIVHGDDPCIVDGKDVYEAAQRLGTYVCMYVRILKSTYTHIMCIYICLYMYIYMYLYIFIYIYIYICTYTSHIQTYVQYECNHVKIVNVNRLYICINLLT
jgi:glycerol-3-phosphate cytidylyltransferase-like family protein